MIAFEATVAVVSIAFVGVTWILSSTFVKETVGVTVPTFRHVVEPDCEVYVGIIDGAAAVA